jgi:hypothetical protein
MPRYYETQLCPVYVKNNDPTVYGDFYEGFAGASLITGTPVCLENVEMINMEGWRKQEADNTSE